MLYKIACPEARKVATLPLDLLLLGQQPVSRTTHCFEVHDIYTNRTDLIEVFLVLQHGMYGESLSKKIT
jgi:hypothetical protein